MDLERGAEARAVSFGRVDIGGRVGQRQSVGLIVVARGGTGVGVRAERAGDGCAVVTGCAAALLMQ